MNNQEMKLARVKKSCGAARIVAKIMAIISCAFAGMAGIGAIGSLLAQDAVNKFLAENPDAVNGHIESDGLINISGDFTELAKEGMAAQGFAATLGIIFFVFALIAAACFILSHVFVKLQTSSSPFNRQLMKPLKIIFIVTVAIMLLFVNPVYAFFIALLLWCVYTIMDYGCVLQEEVDDTI